MEFILLYVIGVMLGILVGLFIARIRRPKTIGNLRVDHSDPDSPYLFLEFTESPETLSKEKEVILRVKIENYIPQK